MTRIKICGLTRHEDIDAVNRYLPDYIGFVFAKSRRQVSDERAMELKSRLDPRISAVGVFVNEDMERIVKLCGQGVIDVVQLHGDEEGDYITRLKQKIRNPVIKAVHVGKGKRAVNVYENIGDFLLFDTYHEGQFGGSGKPFDWSLVEKPDRPYFIAGGINRSNVLSAIETLHPYGVDISSGVEKNGVKDGELIGEIITIIRNMKPGGNNE
mgnify:FL=1